MIVATGETPDARLQATQIGMSLREIRARSLSLGAGAKTASDRSTGSPPRSLVLFGVGALGRMLLGHLRSMGIAPIALSDNNAALWGTTLDGIEVISPMQAAAQFGKTARFCVAVYNGNAPRKQLMDLGCEHVSHFCELHFEHEALLLPFCGLAQPSVYLNAWNGVAAAAYVWHDSQSAAEYLAQLAWRLRIPGAALPPHDPPSQIYFPDGLFKLSDSETFFDCGAFDGDSLRQYLARRPQSGTSRIVAFEPDAASFAKLVEFTESSACPADVSIRLERSAVAERTGKVRFSALGSVRSGVDDSGSAEVAAIALDDVGLAPTFIKMDVEGLELPALRGAATLLTRHRPVLAISLYHHASDLWTIPNYLRSLVPDYRLFLRRYAEDCWELVLYAIPADRLQELR